MFANARATGETTVHLGILTGSPSDGTWAGTLCTSKPSYGQVGPDVRTLIPSKKAVSCLRCLRMARRRNV